MAELMSRNQQSRAAVIFATIELLAETFPACFKIYERRRRPLKVGIHHELLVALDGAIKPEELSVALAVYTKNKNYHAGLVAGAIRIGLDGLPAGTVTPEQAAPPLPPRRKLQASTPRQKHRKPLNASLWPAYAPRQNNVARVWGTQYD
jgi:sRNA-binding protein